MSMEIEVSIDGRLISKQKDLNQDAPARYPIGPGASRRDLPRERFSPLTRRRHRRF
jgi:hypothetical protein